MLFERHQSHLLRDKKADSTNPKLKILNDKIILKKPLMNDMLPIKVLQNQYLSMTGVVKRIDYAMAVSAQDWNHNKSRNDDVPSREDYPDYEGRTSTSCHTAAFL